MFIVFIAIILILCFFLAPVLIVVNRKKIKEMEDRIEVFEGKTFSSPEEKELEKKKLKKELIKIKSGIMGDKKSMEQARDILENV